jgi:hypothetical protein
MEVESGKPVRQGNDGFAGLSVKWEPDIDEATLVYMVRHSCVDIRRRKSFISRP